MKCILQINLVLLILINILSCGQKNPPNENPVSPNLNKTQKQKPVEEGNIINPDIEDILNKSQEFYNNHKIVKSDRNNGVLFVHGAGQNRDYLLREDPPYITEFLRDVDDIPYWNDNVVSDESLFLWWRSFDIGYQMLFALSHYIGAAVDDHSEYKNCIESGTLTDKCISTKDLLIPEVFFRVQYANETDEEFDKACEDAFANQYVNQKKLIAKTSLQLEQNQTNVPRSQKSCYGYLPFQGKTETIYTGSHFGTIVTHSMGGLLLGKACMSYGFCPQNHVNLATPWRGAMQADISAALATDNKLKSLLINLNVMEYVFKQLETNTIEVLSVTNEELWTQDLVRVARFQTKAASCAHIYKQSSSQLKDENDYQPYFTEMVEASEIIMGASNQCNAFNYVYSYDLTNINESCRTKDDKFLANNDNFPNSRANSLSKKLGFLCYNTFKEENWVKTDNGLTMQKQDGMVDSLHSCQAIAPFTYRPDANYEDDSSKLRAWFKDSAEPSLFSLTLGTHQSLSSFPQNKQITNLDNADTYMNHQSWWNFVFSYMQQKHIPFKGLTEQAPGVAVVSNELMLPKYSQSSFDIKSKIRHWPLAMKRNFGYDGLNLTSRPIGQKIIESSLNPKNSSQLIKEANLLSISQGLNPCYLEDNSSSTVSASNDFNNDASFSFEDILSCNGYRIPSVEEIAHFSKSDRAIYIHLGNINQDLSQKKAIFLRNSSPVTYNNIKDNSAVVQTVYQKQQDSNILEVFCLVDESCYLKVIRSNGTLLYSDTEVNPADFIADNKIYLSEDILAVISSNKLLSFNLSSSKIRKVEEVLELPFNDLDYEIINGILVINYAGNKYWRDLRLPIAQSSALKLWPMPDSKLTKYQLNDLDKEPILDDLNFTIGEMKIKDKLFEFERVAPNSPFAWVYRFEQPGGIDTQASSGYFFNTNDLREAPVVFTPEKVGYQDVVAEHFSQSKSQENLSYFYGGEMIFSFDQNSILDIIAPPDLADITMLSINSDAGYYHYYKDGLIYKTELSDFSITGVVSSEPKLRLNSPQNNAIIFRSDNDLREKQFSILNYETNQIRVYRASADDLLKATFSDNTKDFGALFSEDGNWVFFEIIKDYLSNSKAGYLAFNISELAREPIFIEASKFKPLGQFLILNGKTVYQMNSLSIDKLENQSLISADEELIGSCSNKLIVRNRSINKLILKTASSISSPELSFNNGEIEFSSGCEFISIQRNLEVEIIDAEKNKSLGKIELKPQDPNDRFSTILWPEQRAISIISKLRSADDADKEIISLYMLDDGPLLVLSFENKTDSIYNDYMKHHKFAGEIDGHFLFFFEKYADLTKPYYEGVNLQDYMEPDLAIWFKYDKQGNTVQTNEAPLQYQIFSQSHGRVKPKENYSVKINNALNLIIDNSQ